MKINKNNEQYVSPSVEAAFLNVEAMLCTSGGTERLDEVEGSWGDPLANA